MSDQSLRNTPLRPTADAFHGEGLSALSGLEQAQRIKDGTLTSAELVEHYLSRIERFDSELQAFAQVQAETARREAERADRVRKTGGPMGVFHGVPTAVKDHHMIRFTRTTLGSKAFHWLWSPADDGVVRRLRNSGFVLLGKTSMSELGLLPITEPVDGPPTRNPWDTSRTAGGSSGGAGSAIASAMLPLAPGSDGAGSVRIPACLNGLFGHKPTRRLVPDTSEKIDPFGLTAIGPLARSIDDTAALLDVLAGADGAYLQRSREPAPKLRIGVVIDPPFGEVDARILERLELAIQQLRDAGHHVEHRQRPHGTLEEFTPIYQRLVSRIPVLQLRQLEPTTRWFVEAGRRVPAADAMRQFKAMEAVGNSAMAGVDVMITPTVGVIAPKIGEFAHLPPQELFNASAVLGMFTAIANLTGQPGLSVPYGTVDGMPVGIQLLGRKGDDALLLQLARAFDAQT